MTNNARVTNVSRHFTLKHKQAVRAVESCACAWVEFGVSIRDLTYAEAMAARNEQARLADPIARAEMPGLIYRPAEQQIAGHRASIRLMYEANRFSAAVESYA